ncbi:uncharacterized protein LOC123309493 isoform X2 [Coccinella septempunctata]|uniref:uncharacterized protein LOC123309493 isoform X2 n=1 Tax=Coccinella septempunctata TaxID=41139 RepID=UPI001D069376|nr:uncharacterized protein LOC123309493 isoform X2 [Coccinella septempunctata]
MYFLNIGIAIVYLLQICSALRFSRRPLPTSYLLSNQDLSLNYEDTLNFNFPTYSFPDHNSIEKPVEEPQEYVPPQSMGSATIPLIPPPAIPVNAAASNVPSSNGAVYLGSGSIGVVQLSNGAYALGSGSLGYSDGRSQPRPSSKFPVYPPLPASPNLIPAAVPSQPQPAPPSPPHSRTQRFEYTFPVMHNHLRDPNTYEVLRPETVSFGTAPRRPPRPPRMHFATPTYPVQAQNTQYTLTIPPGIPDSDPNQQYVLAH